MARVTRSNIKIKNQRRQTVRNLNKATIEENLEKAKRKIKKAIRMGRRSSTSAELRQLQRQAYVAAKILATVSEDEEMDASSVGGELLPVDIETLSGKGSMVSSSASSEDQSESFAVSISDDIEHTTVCDDDDDDDEGDCDSSR